MTDEIECLIGIVLLLSCTLHGFLRAMTGTNEQKHIDHRRTL